MDGRFGQIFTEPENSVFKVIFYPDRIYHAAYLNATRSPRYRYNVQEVRNKLDIGVLKGEVYLDGRFLSNFVRIEYRGIRLVEQARERGRFLREELMGWVRLLPDDAPSTESMIRLHYDRWIDAYQVELWETLEAPAKQQHDFRVLDMIGRDGQITRIDALVPAMRDIKALRRFELAFRENDIDLPFGYHIGIPEWDNNFGGSHEEPIDPEPSSSRNTITDRNYFLDFRRDWFLQAQDVTPVRYRNAMMDQGNADEREDNIVEMRWLLQRELGGSVVFFHEVTIPPGSVEGTHRHIGTEELYYVVEGEGFAYLGTTDPATEQFPIVERAIYGMDSRPCREVPVKPGSVIFTKSGGIHGIRNPGANPLKFVAFLYHTL